MQTVKCSNPLDIPSKEVFRTLNVVVTKVLIGLDREYAAVKYFVDNINGEAYGSYEAENDARVLACEMQHIIEA